MLGLQRLDRRSILYLWLNGEVRLNFEIFYLLPTSLAKPSNNKYKDDPR